MQASQIFQINSADRISGTATNWSSVIQVDLQERFTHCVLLGASIPKSFTLVQANYNTFSLIEGVLTGTVTITPANYNRRSMSLELARALTAASPNGWTYSVTYDNQLIDPDTGRYYFAVTGNGGVQPSLAFSSTCYEVCGFQRNSTNAFTANALVSTGCIKLTAEDTLVLHSNICDVRVSDVFETIYAADTSYYSIVVFNANDTSRAKRFIQAPNQIYNFKLTNEYGEVLDTRGLNVNLTVLLFRSYDADMLEAMRLQNRARALGKLSRFG